MIVQQQTQPMPKEPRAAAEQDAQRIFAHSFIE
jgi:hypothetical protein